MPGINKQIIQTGGGSSTPGGADTQIQFNDGGAFGGDARFTFDKSTGGATGGDFNAEAGASLDGYGGSIYAQGGRVGVGGSIQASAGNASSIDSFGGQLYFGSGSGYGTGNGGLIRFQAGGGGAGGEGGSVQFEAGPGLTNGKYLFKTTSGLYSGELNYESLTANRTYTFPNATGTLALTSDIVGTNLSYTASTRLLESSTGTDVTLPLFTSTEAGLTPLSGGGTTNFLRADGTWAAPTGASGITRSISSISTNTSAGSTASTDYVYICTATLTLTLPTAVGNTNRYTIKNTGGTTTIATTSSQTIDGSTTATLSTLYSSIDLVSDNSNWVII